MEIKQLLGDSAAFLRLLRCGKDNLSFTRHMMKGRIFHLLALLISRTDFFFWAFCLV